MRRCFQVEGTIGSIADETQINVVIHCARLLFLVIGERHLAIGDFQVLQRERLVAGAGLPCSLSARLR